MQRLLFLLFMMFHILSFGQNEVKRSYEISPAKGPQTLVLTEYENGKFQGYILTELDKVDGIRRKEFIDKYNLDSLNVKQLMDELKQKGIEDLKSCREDPECPETNYLHPSFIRFVIETDSIKELGYQEIHPLIGKNNRVESTKLRAKAQSLLTIACTYVDFEKQFSNLKKRLPSGTYKYPFRDAYYALLKVENKN